MALLVARALLAGLLSVGLAACGTGATVDRRGRPVVLDVGEFHVAPNRVLVSRGPVEFDVRNVGRLAHRLAFGQGAFIDRQTPILKPGQRAQLTMMLHRGLYRAFDPLGNNDAAGTSGFIVVR